jgi:hypothetical protein
MMRREIVRVTNSKRCVCLTVCAVFLLASCSSMRALLPGGDKAQDRAAFLQQLQVQVMRFADEYTGQVAEQTRRLEADVPSAEDRLRAQNWQLSQATAAYINASGPNPIVSTLDMVVLATLSRMAMEDYWVDDLYGARAAQLKDAHVRLEREAWTLLDGVLNDEQITQLHLMIDAWRVANPEVRAVAYTHFREFARATSPSESQERSNNSLLGLLGLDPLSSLDPAAREIAQTRQLAERAIYYAQRAPNLLDMQVQRVAYQFATMPETKNFLTTTDRFGDAAESIGQLAGSVPNIVSTEREAAIRQIMTSLATEQQQLRGVIAQVQSALQGGAATSDSLRDTIRTLDSFVARFDKPDKRATGDVASTPFDIRPYTDAVRELGGTAREMQALIVELDRSSAGTERLASSAALGLQAVIDRAFSRLIWLVLITVAAVFAAAVGYTLIAVRIATRS